MEKDNTVNELSLKAIPDLYGKTFSYQTIKEVIAGAHDRWSNL